MEFNKDDYMELLKVRGRGALGEKMGIEVIEASPERMVGTMPVEGNTQPMGLLHGGASAALIETIGSMGSLLIIDSNREIAVGLEVNANHVNGISSGFVLAKGKIIHAGKKTHLWQIDITEEGSNKLICVGKLTVMILEKRTK